MRGVFVSRLRSIDGASLKVPKSADTWTVAANGNEHYRPRCLYHRGLIGASRSKIHALSTRTEP